MAEGDNRGNPQNPKPQDAESEGGKPEFLLEKFGSVEDQAKGYAELEKKYHADLDNLKQEVKSLKQGPRPEELQPRSGGVSADEDSQELVEFYKSPSQYRARVIAEAEQRVEHRILAREAVKQTLSNFFSSNQDLVGQEKLLEGYVREEDPNLDAQSRLQNAAKRTREHISNLRKAPESKPNPSEFVDAPSGSQTRTVPKPTATEADLRKEFFDSRSGSRKQPPKRFPQGE